MNEKYWMLLLLLASISIVLLALSTISKAQDIAVSSNSVELHIGNDTYVLLFSVRSPVFIPTENRVSLDVEASLVYATSNKPIFVITNIQINGVNVASAVLGYFSFNKTTRVIHVEAFIPPVLAEQINNGAKVSFLAIQVKAYRNSTSTSAEVKIPIVLTKLLPLLQLRASFTNGLPYTLAIIGYTPYVEAKIYLINSGPTILHDINIFIQVDGNTIASIHVADALSPGDSINTSAYIPVPLKPGSYSIRIIAKAISGLKEVESDTNLVLITLPRVSIGLSMLNSTTLIEGQRLCIRAVSSNVPSYARPSIAIDLRSDTSQWSTLVIVPNTTNTTYCFQIPVLGLTGQKVYQLRARLILSIYGLRYEIASNVIRLTILPLENLVRYASLQLVTNKPEVYIAENIKLDILLSPATPVCLPVIIERYSLNLSAWEPIGSTKICQGEGIFTIPASSLGTGIHRIRGVLRIGNFIIISNVVAINVVKQPYLSASIRPKIAAPNTTVIVYIHVKRLVNSYKLIVKPSWTNTTISIIASGDTSLPLKAPPSEGYYHVYVKAIIDGYSVERDLVLKVAKIIGTLIVKPEVIKAGETKNVTISISITPQANATALTRIISGKNTIATYNITIINGKGRISVPAPSKPGNYTISAVIEPYGVTISKNIQVIRIIYGLSLSLNATSVKPGSSVRAKVTITPAPKSPTNIVLMIRKKNGTWEVIGGGIAVHGNASIVFKAPSEPGSYELRASAPGLKAESNIVELVVTSVVRTPPRRLQLYAIIGAVIVAALAWSIRSIRR